MDEEANRSEQGSQETESKESASGQGSSPQLVFSTEINVTFSEGVPLISSTSHSLKTFTESGQTEQLPPAEAQRVFEVVTQEFTKEQKKLLGARG